MAWYQSFDDQAVMSSNLTIPIYLIKNYAQGNVAKELSLEGVY
jgi:hypothetical protein